MTRLLAAGLAVLIVAWAVVNLTVQGAAFAIPISGAMQSVVAATTLAKLFAALVLFLLSVDRERWRLRWVAGGVGIIALGQLAARYLEPLLEGTPDPNIQLYGNVIRWTVACALFVVGLVPVTPPRFSLRWMLVVLAVFGVLSGVAVAGVDLLPPMVHTNVMKAYATRSSDASLPGLTGWHWALSSLPLALAVAAALGAVRLNRKGMLAGWVVVAMALLAGSQLHNLIWPSSGSPVLSTTHVLRLALAAAVVIGGIIELRRVAVERSALLAAEQERTNRLRELAALKADFTAMVAHELGSPLAAIQGYADMLSSEKLASDRRARALDAIRAETDALNALIADVRASATVERDDFTIRPVPVALETLLSDAEAYARTLPGEHPLVTNTTDREERVLADADRIGQVLRNLLSNAAKYSPEGTPVEIKATPREECVRIEVCERGPGIHPDDLSRIFEKFGRGRDENGREVVGAGLGLYLSRRIVRAHGSKLTVDTKLGKGSSFAFELEIAR